MSGFAEAERVMRRVAPGSRFDMGHAMRARVDELISTVLAGQGAEELRGYLLQLVSRDHLAWAVSGARDHVLAVGDSDEPRSSVRVFPDWLVAVTACSTPLDRALGSFPGAYLGLLAGLTREAYESSEGRHIAHWVICPQSDGLKVFLTVIPNHRVSGAPLLFPRSLLSEEERRLMRLAGEPMGQR